MIASEKATDLEIQFRHAADAAINAANPRFGPYIDVVAHPLNLLQLLDEYRRLAALAESGEAAHAELNAWLGYATDLNEQLKQHRALLDRAMAAMKALHEAAWADEATPDFDAVIPGARFAEFVDAHAALLYDIKHARSNPTKPSSNGMETL